MIEKFYTIIKYFNIFWGEEKMKTKEWLDLIIANFHSWMDIHIWIQAHSLFGAWSFLLVHMQFTPRLTPHGFFKLGYS